MSFTYAIIFCHLQFHNTIVSQISQFTFPPKFSQSTYTSYFHCFSQRLINDFLNSAVFVHCKMDTSRIRKSNMKALHDDRKTNRITQITGVIQRSFLSAYLSVRTIKKQIRYYVHKLCRPGTLLHIGAILLALKETKPASQKPKGYSTPKLYIPSCIKRKFLLWHTQLIHTLAYFDLKIHTLEAKIDSFLSFI